MQFLMLMWTEANAASGEQADFDAWNAFDQEVKDAGVFVQRCVATGCRRGAARADQPRRP